MEPKSVLKKLVTNQSLKSNCPTPFRYGKENDETAAQQYVKLKQHEQNVTFCLSCGLIVNQSFPWLRASPDFLVFDTHKEASQLGLGEMKCRYTKRDFSILED